MASCYGGEAPNDNELQVTIQATLVACPYLPLNYSTRYRGEIVELELGVFKTDAEYHQGFELMNFVIAEGLSWPYLEAFPSLDAYKGYFHSHAAFLVRFKDSAKYGSEVLGCFYVKPNFPGRCSHICNGGFITNPKYRGIGVATFMGMNFRRLAKDLGYRASLFNLVFANNEPSVRLWKKLGFKQLAVLPKAAQLKGIDGFVDAIQFYSDFYEDEEKGEETVHSYEAFAQLHG